MLTAKEFKPDESGFYSKGLYLWLKKNPFLNRIYSATWNWTTGYDPERRVLMVGLKDDDNWFHGAPLRAVCFDRGSRQAFAFGMTDHRVSEWTDVTDDFIDQYRKIGKCHIHGDRAHDFKMLSNTHKQCLHCGKEYFRKSMRVIKHTWEESL